MFDPYRKWLGIPEGNRPPTHYQLLGIAPEEQDSDVIDAAVIRQSAYVRNFQAGKYSEDATRILNEIAAAKVCLLNPTRRAEYDVELRKRGAFDAPALPTPGPGKAARTATQAAAQASSHSAGKRPGPAVATRPQPASLAPLNLLDELAPALLPEPRRPANTRGLPSLRKRKKPAAFYWQVPLAVGLVMVVVFVAMKLAGNGGGSSDQVAGLPRDTQGGLQGGAINAQAGGNQAQPGAGLTGLNQPDAGSPNKTSTGSIKPAAGGMTPGVTGSNPQASSTQPAAVVGSSKAEQPATDTSSGAAMSSSAGSSGPVSSGTGPGDMVHAGDVAWGDAGGVSVPLPERDAVIVFARSPSPFVTVGKQVWDLNSGEVTGKIRFAPRDRTLRALSPDGKLFASADESGLPTIEIWSCETGKRISVLPFEKTGVEIRFLEFASPDRLISSARVFSDQRVQVWDVTASKLIREFEVDEFESKLAAISDDGNFLAIATSSAILVYDVRKGKKWVARAVPPETDEPLFGFDGLRFSPDGQEIAAVAQRGSRILCWNGKTELIYDEQINANLKATWTGAFVYEGPPLEWDPSGRGWLLNGHFLYHRERHRLVWMLRSQWNHDARMRFRDAEYLMVPRGEGRNRELASLKVPWKQIEASLEAMDSGAEAWLGPAQAISLLIETPVTTFGGDPRQVSTELYRVLTDRLRVDGIRVTEGQPTMLRVRYVESTIQRQTIAPGQRFGPRGGPPALIQTSATKCTVELSLTTASGSEAAWNTSVEATSNSTSSTGQAAGIRDGILDNAAQALRQTPIPYFIPRDKSLVTLPAISRL